ncbi:PREDICTED: adenine phosphoribosyltransferase isoform X2 [Nicrophorus vespilloides]|nr:PREDICTED: adenine phosphoribosyltransferase isoform X2 [Nicrophorus vespilloides]
MSGSANKIDEIKKAISSYPDFPIKGILFRDVFSVLRQPKIFGLLRDVMVEHAKQLQPPVQVVAALESRGFLFGPLIALELNVPFVPIRKKGKLPGMTRTVQYSLEYGQDAFEMQEDAVKQGDRVLIVDDLLATGGSMSASCSLVNAFGAEVAECFVVMELSDLNGRAKIAANVHSLIQYD